MGDPARDIGGDTAATVFKASRMNDSTVPAAAQVASIATPINLILLSLFLILAYMRLRPSKSTTTVLPTPPSPTVYRVFTPPQLQPFNGQNNQPVYLAVRGRIFDVTSGRNFYGPGGPYANFAGRDASRGLACGSFDEEMLTEDLKGPLDRLEDLGGEEMEALKGWEERFQEKYLVVGKLVPVGHDEAEEDEKTL
ncbi:Dihydrodipicolinate synthase [Friedmanniomyces endolithicus]|uniref:Dihydrodipicolinate synthase n=1 Tax=Friedmanniomyces endolithicus TaxID=329885 RepID=A0AAN6H798_9PEZI|nr:Dihydrodipicolinate synthase [Friedmanniomyces endolithicus]KAK0773453.1 Dihydrodipicolinate synthase [Friedmanniomyces endolithicus]KAK0825586.1 Dihydrodipicolinate synthase [Friedmanniomyces endolithicus]KAK0846240.1 Dihydrodipicolinate synthase [Friedmanniomyces endolithicus]KAK0896211.1 Dihydrodipicolinate synthase [Friedmanniomyces endolithicus]